MKNTKKTPRPTVKSGIVQILSTFNNTLVTITDREGNVLSWASAGAMGFKGARKSTPYAAGLAVAEAAKRARTNYGLEEVDVRVSGVGSGREAAVRSLGGTDLHVLTIRDVTPIPHNGPRPKKPRRV